jgi:hypothetical protein
MVWHARLETLQIRIQRLFSALMDNSDPKDDRKKPISLRHYTRDIVLFMKFIEIFRKIPYPLAA